MPGSVPKAITYAGSLAQPAFNGGLAWFHLQFLLGLQRLGWDVLFVDRLEPAMCRDSAGNAASFASCVNHDYFLQVMESFGLGGSFSLIYNRGEQVIGLPRDEVRRRAANGPLLNVMGFLDDEAILQAADSRVFVDIDPGFGQMWRELAQCDMFRGHDHFVTMGRNIGQPGCGIPTCGLEWITVAQPVVLDHWPAQPPPARGAYTSIGAWRGPNDPIEYQGHRYGLRAHEFRKFIALPTRCGSDSFEMALDIDPADAKDIDALRAGGWKIIPPKSVAATPADYRSYIAGSKAEFMVPKQMYVDTISGLLSDRSAYYLATGRPVLARDTGIGNLYPTGRGLLAFSTLDEAAAGVEAINRDYAGHCRAAREIATEYFDSDKVLKKLLADLGIE